MPRLGVNIDHVATLRQARGGCLPDPVLAARIAEESGADGITLHLREDRRHVQDSDLEAIVDMATVPVNLELAASEDVLSIAETLRPINCCLVPERREELTTEGGLDVIGAERRLCDVVARLQSSGIRVQLFIDPSLAQVEAAARIGADGVEIHTGRYANAIDAGDSTKELDAVAAAITEARNAGLRGHAGHGLDYDNVIPVARLAGMEELNIGHAIVARALFDGLGSAVRKMKALVSLTGAPTDA